MLNAKLSSYFSRYFTLLSLLRGFFSENWRGDKDEFLNEIIVVLRSAIENSRKLPVEFTHELLGYVERFGHCWWDNLGIEPKGKYKEQLLKGVCTIGNEPLKEQEIDQLIKYWGYPVHGYNLASEILIIGYDLDKYEGEQPFEFFEAFISVLQEKANGELRIYSQELFLYSIFS